MPSLTVFSAYAFATVLTVHLGTFVVHLSAFVGAFSLGGIQVSGFGGSWPAKLYKWQLYEEGASKATGCYTNRHPLNIGTP